MPNHNILSTGEIHQIYDQEYADTTARDADTDWNTDSTNIGKVVRITSNDSFFILISTTPTWEGFGSSSVDNIYNADGTISDARTVTLANDLAVSPDTDGSHDVAIGTSLSDRINSFQAFGDSSVGLNAGATNDRSFITAFGTAFKGVELGYFLNETSLMGFRINFFDDGDFEAVDQINSKGIIYAADYSANFTDRSLVDKGYADGISLYESNGTITDSVRTVLTADGGNLNIVSYDVNGSSAYAERSRLVVDDQSISMYHHEGTGGGSDSADKSIRLTTNQMLVTDTTDEEGFEYAADYSLNWGARHIPDVAYVWYGDNFLSGNDKIIYEGANDTTTELVTLHGDGNHSLFDPYVTLHEGYKTGNGTDTQPLIVNYGKGVKVQFNDGTASVDVFYTQSVVNGAQTFTHMETSFQSIRHDYIELDQFDWTFDTGASAVGQWTVYGDEAKSIEILNVNRSLTALQIMNSAHLMFESDNVSEDRFRMNTNGTNWRLQFRDESAATNTNVLVVGEGGTVSAPNGEIANQDGNLVVPFPSQIVGTTDITVTTSNQVIVLTSASPDGSGSEYTIDLPNSHIEMDAADGSKIYEVTYTARFDLEGQGTTGATRSYGIIEARLDDIAVATSESWTYIREYQGGTNGIPNAGGSATFLIQPAAADELDFVVRGATDAGQTLTTFVLTNFVVTIKRVA